MRTDLPQPVRLTDYRPPAYLIDEVHLDFDLKPAATRVKARLSLRRNGEHAEPLVLDGVRLKPVSFAIDGRALEASEYEVGEESLTIASAPAAFVLETEVEIDPQANKALEGLYMSAGRFCTQCESEGFRKITWYADRPDVLARFTVRMEADKLAYPRLLSNGNLTESGDLPHGRHYAVWNDPFPKPSYLFALVAGELDELADSLVTMSGRTVELRIYVDPGMVPRALYAMDSLKRAMRWDEQTFGREYDLDLFMIVAVRDFNFGAMENKGLNIFNSSLVLADPETATDFDYERIEGVVAHEYFHNWTGDRITCRDWFQLCLKEGLTVFRDQSFSADMRGHAVQRIKEVKALRARQFAEDAGPMAHPVRPSSYLKIENFYTATIYDKGAEVIRMLKTLIGADMFRKGMDLYFERWDGHATTVEAFIQCFADVSGRDLTDFFAWYEQAGTPAVSIETAYDEAAKTLELKLAQFTAPTPGQPTKRPLPTPLAIGLLDADGRVQSFRAPDGEEKVEETVIVLDEASRTVRLEGVERPPVLSALRGFSAPVKLTTDSPPRDRYVLLAGDPDLFNRWEAGQDLARDLILARAAGSPDEVAEERFATAVGRGLDDQSADPALKALLLALPSEVRPGPGGVSGRSGGDPPRPRGPARAAGDPSRRDPASAARRPAGARRILHRRRGGRPARPAQRGAGDPGRRSRRPQPRAGRGPFRRRRQHDRRHGGLKRPDADGRRAVREGARRLLRAMEGRAAGDRQMVRHPVAQPRSRRPGPGAGPDRPSRVRSQEPQPLARAGGRVRHGQSVSVP